jgi:cyclopropane-fatty-acyl-phospholipid synthase
MTVQVSSRSIASIGSQPVDGALRFLLRRRFGAAPLRFELRDGTDLSSLNDTPVATVVARDRATLLGLILAPERRFGDAYASGAIDVRGDLVGALESAYRALDGGRRRRLLPPFRERHPVRASRARARHHYDLGNDFYRLWLDDQLVYSCAYFPTPCSTLEEAQVVKLDRICRKLRLRPGEHVIEAGCGWGALALHMAREHGVSVSAYNVSTEQLRWARERAEREGLSGRVAFVEGDYREITGRCDAFVSIGMLEHVGLDGYHRLGAVIERTLDPDHGRGLLHFIGRDRPRPLDAWTRKRIFPGAYPPTLAEVIEGVLAPPGFGILDVENLRRHYAETLAHWRVRFDSFAPAMAVHYGRSFTRAWRLYLAGSEAAFRTGWLQLFQVVFARSSTPCVSWTRGGPADE